MAKSDKKNFPSESETGKREALATLHKLGSLEEVLNSGVSLEIKAACIEMEIEARRRRQQGTG